MLEEEGISLSAAARRARSRRLDCKASSSSFSKTSSTRVGGFRSMFLDDSLIKYVAAICALNRRGVTEFACLSSIYTGWLQ